MHYLTILSIVLINTQVSSPNSIGISLPFRPVASKRTSTINFITKVLTLKKEYDLKAHEKYFNNIINLWTSIFLEYELTNDQTHSEPIELTNPECRDLRAITMDAINSVSQLLKSNLIPHNPIRHRRSIKPPNYIYQKSTSITLKLSNTNRTKRAFLAKTALSLIGSYMAKQTLSSATHAAKGIIPIGGSILALAFGIAQRGEVEQNAKRINLISNQFINHHNKLIRFANLTKIVLDEMEKLISRNDARITNLFNLTINSSKKNRRGIICLQLYSESSYLIETVKTSINNFILADTLLPKGNKNLFSEAELRTLLMTEQDQTLATGNRNFWDYSLFNIKRNNNAWIYEIQVPLTNLPTFTSYTISPFPVYPISNNGSAYTVDIPEDSSVILSNDDKYFIDKIYKERCTFSNTHGICPGPVGLIDTDLCNCKVSLLMFETNRMHDLCKFRIYKGHSPRIATSMGKFIISSNEKHDFIQSCANNSRSHTTIYPGTTKLITIKAGCTLNTTDIKLLNPSGINSITNQKLGLAIEPIFRFQQSVKINNHSILTPGSPNIKRRIKELELVYENNSDLNEHISSNSSIYVTIAISSIVLLLVSIITLYLKIKIITPVINTVRKYWAPRNHNKPQTPSKV